MNHIQLLEIINYQSWKHALLEFHPGVNVILGSSDKGKSSIVRALNWACFNRPTGNSFRSNFTKKPTEVSLSLDDQTICRKKGDKENTYNINGADENLQALRSDIPEEIKDITRMGLVNIQPQNESYFLLNDTPGQVAKKFNEIAGLEIMDKSLQAVNSAIRLQKQEIKMVDKDLEALDKKIEDLDWLEPCEKILNNLEDNETELQQISKDISELDIVYTKYLDIKAETDKLPAPEVLTFVENLLDLDNDLYETEQKLAAVEKLLERHSKLDKDIKRLSVLQDAKLSSPDAVRSSIGRLNEKIKIIQTLLHRFQFNSTGLSLIKPQILEAEEDLNEFKRETKVCPTCNQPWGVNYGQ